METQNKVIEEIGAMALTVAEQHAEYGAAIDAEQTAEAAVLQRAIDLAGPALRAICGRMKSIDGSSSGNNPVERVEWLPGRYMVLVNSEGKRRDTTGNEGWYEGTLLLLDDRGALHETTASGSWSRWQGAWSTQERTIAPITPHGAMAVYNLDECLGAIAAALRKQVEGTAVDKAAAARARAEKLAAVAALAK